MSQASSRMVRAAEATAELWSYSWVTSSSTPQLLKPGVLARSNTRSILVLYRRQLCTDNTGTNHALFVILALSLLQFTQSVQSQVRFKACTHNTDTNCALFVVFSSDSAVTQTFSIKLGEILSLQTNFPADSSKMYTINISEFKAIHTNSLTVLPLC